MLSNSVKASLCLGFAILISQVLPIFASSAHAHPEKNLRWALGSLVTHEVGNLITLEGPNKDFRYSQIHDIQVGLGQGAAEQIAVVASVVPTLSLKTSGFYVVDIWDVIQDRHSAGYNQVNLKFKGTVYRTPDGDYRPYENETPIPQVQWEGARLHRIGDGLSPLTARFGSQSIEINRSINQNQVRLYQEFPIRKEVENFSVLLNADELPTEYLSWYSNGHCQSTPTALAINQDWIVVGYQNGLIRVRHRASGSSSFKFIGDASKHSILSITLDPKISTSTLVPNTSTLLFVTINERGDSGLYSAFYYPQASSAPVVTNIKTNRVLQHEPRDEGLESGPIVNRKFDLARLGTTKKGTLVAIGREFGSIGKLVIQYGLSKDNDKNNQAAEQKIPDKSGDESRDESKVAVEEHDLLIARRYPVLYDSTLPQVSFLADNHYSAQNRNELPNLNSVADLAKTQNPLTNDHTDLHDMIIELKERLRIEQAQSLQTQKAFNEALLEARNEIKKELIQAQVRHTALHAEFKEVSDLNQLHLQQIKSKDDLLNDMRIQYNQLIKQKDTLTHEAVEMKEQANAAQEALLSQLSSTQYALNVAQLALAEQSVLIDPVSLDPIEQKDPCVAIPCGHVFLAQVLTAHRQTNGDECPMCTQAFSKERVLPLLPEFDQK